MVDVERRRAFTLLHDAALSYLEHSSVEVQSTLSQPRLSALCQLSLRQPLLYQLHLKFLSALTEKKFMKQLTARHLFSSTNIRKVARFKQPFSIHPPNFYTLLISSYYT
jgi:hypothetical protein